MHIHVNEYWDCLDNSDNLSVQVTMWDAVGGQVGYMPRTQAGASASANMGSKLEDQLVITPEWANGGYIQFQLGALQFNTKDDTDNSKPSYCNWGGWDPREGPTCYIGGPDGTPTPIHDAFSLNQIDCWFPRVSAPHPVASWDKHKLTSNSLSGMVEVLPMEHPCNFLLS